MVLKVLSKKNYEITFYVSRIIYTIIINLFCVRHNISKHNKKFKIVQINVFKIVM